MKKQILPRISVIIPVYNAADTIGRALKSVMDIPRRNEIEVVVIDDCSTDNTKDVVNKIRQCHPNIVLYSMPENSGGPSAPRNLGIGKAQGEYVTFLDDDDWVDAGNMLKMADYASENGLDFLNGYLIVVNGQTQTVHNRLHEIPKSDEDVLKNIIAFQSANSVFLTRREVLEKHDIRYCTDIKIGEDTVFMAEILINSEKIGYIDEYFLFHNTTTVNLAELASTQRCGDREINHQITAWERAEEILSKSGTSLSYYELRLHVGIRNLLLSIVRFSNGISEETYRRLHRFCLDTRTAVRGKMSLHKRYEDLYKAILEGDFAKYCEISKRRLLIAGYDLKFITPVIPYLEGKFNVRVDEWTGHAVHNEKQSRECAEWADIIWCEWLLGNAVYYCRQKNANQRLIIRAHRFELGREFGRQIDYSKVDNVIAVSYYYFEQFAEQFAIPREKMRLLPNYVEDVIYSDSAEKSPDARFHIGIVGFVPKLKGFYRALELLAKLRQEDSRFKLYAMGRKPEELSWLKNSPDEAEYFETCEKFIQDNALSDAVVYGGFVERRELYKDIGYVLSLSDIESFHLAPAEGACAGCMGLMLRQWHGVEYIYPKEAIFDSLDDMAAHILRASSDSGFYAAQAAALRDYVMENYRLDRFLEILDRYFKQLFLI